MKSTLAALLLCVTACTEIEPGTRAAPLIDDEVIPEVPAPALTCTGKARCGCYKVNANGTESKITGVKSTGTCDPANNCAATCSPCAQGTARVEGDNCALRTVRAEFGDDEIGDDEATDAPELSMLESWSAPAAASAMARVASAACACELRLNGVRHGFTAAFDPAAATFAVSSTLADPRDATISFARTLNPTIAWSCEEACAYGVSSWIGLSTGVGDAP